MAAVKINAIEVSEGAEAELEKRFANRLHAVDGQPGFLSFELLRPVSGEKRYFVLTHWEDEESFQAWLKGPAMEAYSGERARPSRLGLGAAGFRGRAACGGRRLNPAIRAAELVAGADALLVGAGNAVRRASHRPPAQWRLPPDDDGDALRGRSGRTRCPKCGGERTPRCARPHLTLSRILPHRPPADRPARPAG